jgi:hypothetical protein
MKGVYFSFFVVADGSWESKRPHIYEYHVKTIEMDVTNNTTRFCPVELIWYQKSKIINFI